MNPPPLHPPRPLKWAASLTRALLWAVVGVWLLVAMTWSAIHVFIVPRIGDWRTELETLATRAVGVPVRIGHIAVHTQGLVPSFELTGVRLLDADHRDALVLERVVTAVSARSLLRLGFEQIHIANPTLDVRRSADGRWWVAGLDLLGAPSERGEDTPAVDWFFSQTEFVIQSGTVHWTDDLRQQPRLTLANVDLVVRNPGRQHLLRVDATPQDHLGQRFTLQGVFTSPLLTLHPGRWRNWSGTAHASLPAVDMARMAVPTALAERFDLRVTQGTGALQLWVDVANGQPTGGTADLALTGVAARFAQAQRPLGLASLQGRMTVGLAPDKVSVDTEGLTFVTENGTRWAQGDVSLVLREHPTHTSGELRASRIDLGALHELSSGLPLAPGPQAQLARVNPLGELSSLKLNWQSRDGTWPSFSAKGRVAQLALAPGDPPAPASSGSPGQALPGRPGLVGATVTFELDQDGGHAKVSMGRGWLSFPGVFEEPNIPIDQLSTDVRWQLKGPDIQVHLPNLRFANADLQGQASAQWQTSDPDQSPARARFPGVLKLDGTLSRAKGERVHRYLPLVVGPVAKDYVKTAILGGKSRNVRFRVAGDLWQMPFVHPADGEFRVAAQLTEVDYAFIPPGLTRATGTHWPVLKQAAGELVFERDSMTVQITKGGVADAPGLHVSQAKAHIAHLMERPVVEVNAQLDGPLHQALGVVRRSPLSGLTGQALAQSTGTGNVGIQFGLSVPLNDTQQTRVKGRVTLPGNDVRLTTDSPVLARTRGVVEFSDTGFQVPQATAQLLGGEITFAGGMRPDGTTVQFSGQGTATAPGLAQASFLALPPALTARASGSTSYAVQLSLRHGGVPEWSVQSPLVGLGLNFPAPMGKTTDQNWNLRYQNRIDLSAGSGAPGRETRQLSFTPDERLLAVATLSQTAETSGTASTRGILSLGPRDGPPPALPTQGFSLLLKLPTLDVDPWLNVFAPQPLSSPSTAPPPEELPDGWRPQRLQLETDRLVLGGRAVHQLRLSAHATTDEGSPPRWRANVQAKELSGTLTYLPPQTTGAPRAGGADMREGHLVARLQRLALNTATPAAGAPDAPPPGADASLPALDVVVDAFQLDGRDLGQLTLDASNRAAGPRGGREWLLHRLALKVPEAQLTASGTWAPTVASNPGGARQTALQLELVIDDAGALLQRFGMPGVFRGGKGQVRGDVTWQGLPSRLHPPSLSGQLKLDLASGQFLKADPGLAKLLGVLNLQSLPRRLTLDFSDVFAEGFAFDFVRGDAHIEQGVLHTNNLQMKGPNAAVLMEGQADVVRETQHIRALVVPELNAGTASLIATVINPAVGLGTFLAQAVLRQPLIAVSSQSFLIHGPWADPQVDKIGPLTEPANLPKNR